MPLSVTFTAQREGPSILPSVKCESATAPHLATLSERFRGSLSRDALDAASPAGSDYHEIWRTRSTIACNGALQQRAAVPLLGSQWSPSPQAAQFWAFFRGNLRSISLAAVCAAVSFALIAIGVVAPPLVLQHTGSTVEAAARALEESTGVTLASCLSASMIDALVLVRTLHGFVLSAFPSLPPFNATPDAAGHYNVDPYFTRFGRVASLIASQNPAVLSQALCPGGVVTMNYPYSAISIGRDLLDPSDPTYVYKPTPLEVASSGQAVVFGPRPSEVRETVGQWVVDCVIPMYNRTTSEPPTLENFWGFVYLIISMQSALAAFHLNASAQSDYLDYVVFSTNLTSNGTSVISTSLPADTSAAAMADFIASSTVTDVLSPFSSLQIAIRTRRAPSGLASSLISPMALWSMLTGFGIMAITLALIMCCVQEYDAARHAPKMAPFAMLTIGPHRGEALWDLAPEEMAESTERAGKLLARHMARHGMYPIQAEYPFTVCYAARHVSSAVQMAFGLIEELQRHPIDAPPRAVLSEDAGRLEVCCAVHWCTDAAVRVESLQGSYRYEGPDVVFGGRMWAFAAPDVVTASAAVVEQLSCRGLVGVVAHAYQGVGSLTEDALKEVTVASAVQQHDWVDVNLDGALASHVSSVDSPHAEGQLYLLLHPSQPALLAAAAAAIAATAPTLMPEDAESVMQATHSLAFEDSTAASDTSVTTPRLTVSDVVVRFEAASTWDATPAELQSSPALRDVRHPNSGGAEQGSPPTSQLLCAARVVSLQQQLCRTRNPTARHPLAGHRRGALQAISGVSRHSSAAGTVASSVSPAYVDTDPVTRALLQPTVPRTLDVALRTAFDQHAVIVGTSYDEVRPLVYYFYMSYKILFRPLAGPERHNIFRRLVSTFGVPQQGVLEHLAVCGALQWVAEVRRVNGLLTLRTSRVPCRNTAPRTYGQPPPSLNRSASLSTLTLDE